MPEIQQTYNAVTLSDQKLRELEDGEGADDDGDERAFSLQDLKRIIKGK